MTDNLVLSTSFQNPEDVAAMKWIIFSILGFLICSPIFLSFFSNSKSQMHEFHEETQEKVREKRKTHAKLADVIYQRVVLPLKIMRIPKPSGHLEFEVDRRDVSTIEQFMTDSGDKIRKLVLKNFDSSEKVRDRWHERMIRATNLDLREDFLDYSGQGPQIVLDNCYGGWFPFDTLAMPAGLKEVVIHIDNALFDCDPARSVDKFPPGHMKLVDRFSSFVVRIDHHCPWRYWNFDVTNIDLEVFSLDGRTDLNYTSNHRVAMLKVKGFENELNFLNTWLVKPLRLDWVREVGIENFDYHNGIVRFENVTPHAALLFPELSRLNYPKSLFARSAPFVIDSANHSCLSLTEKTILYERFGIVALQIIEKCPVTERVIILDGRQPFDYVSGREDIQYKPGQKVVYARVRDFTTEDHMRNLDQWFKEMGFYDVLEVGDERDAPNVPEVVVTGCITTFLPFPYIKKIKRGYQRDLQYSLPSFYFRNNSGLDCRDRGVIRSLRRVLGKFSVVTSRDCECGPWTSSDFFWKHCIAHRGTLEISGSPSEKELLRYKSIRKIRNGQLWIHDTKTVKDMSFLPHLSQIECRGIGKNLPKSDMYAAVRVDGHNPNLETMDLPELLKTRECKKFVQVVGERDDLPMFGISPWMDSIKRFNSVSIRQRKNCTADTGVGGGNFAEFSHGLSGCTEINGNLLIDGAVDDIPQITAALRNIRRIRGHVTVQNLNSTDCRLLQYVKRIDGNLTYQNNPFLRKASFGLLYVHEKINFFWNLRFCRELQRMKPFVEGFKQRVFVTDCAFYSENMFHNFETLSGDVQRFSDICLSYSMMFIVCYMMVDVFTNYGKCLNVNRWKRWTPLDERLKVDPTAYLDEDSSEEEIDVKSLVRTTRQKARLDGRDVEGERIEGNIKEYRIRRRGIQFKEKMEAQKKSLTYQESDSDYSGQSWMRRKRSRWTKQKWQEKYGMESTESSEAELFNDPEDERQWTEPWKPRPIDMEEDKRRQSAFIDLVMNQVNDVMEEKREYDQERRQLLIEAIREQMKEEEKEKMEKEEKEKVEGKKEEGEEMKKKKKKREEEEEEEKLEEPITNLKKIREALDKIYENQQWLDDQEWLSSMNIRSQLRAETMQICGVLLEGDDVVDEEEDAIVMMAVAEEEKKQKATELKKMREAEMEKARVEKEANYKKNKEREKVQIAVEEKEKQNRMFVETFVETFNWKEDEPEEPEEQAVQETQMDVSRRAPREEQDEAEQMSTQMSQRSTRTAASTKVNRKTEKELLQDVMDGKIEDMNELVVEMDGSAKTAKIPNMNLSRRSTKSFANTSTRQGKS